MKLYAKNQIFIGRSANLTPYLSEERYASEPSTLLVARLNDYTSKTLDTVHNSSSISQYIAFNKLAFLSHCTVYILLRVTGSSFEPSRP